MWYPWRDVLTNHLTHSLIMLMIGQFKEIMWHIIENKYVCKWYVNVIKDVNDRTVTNVKP